jgi:WD40 repeat protein
VAASADHTTLASASSAPDASGYAEICLWSTLSGCKRHVLMQHTACVQHMAFSPDGVWLVSVSSSPENLVVLWDVGSGRAVAIGHTAGASRDLVWLTPVPGASDVEFVTGALGREHMQAGAGCPACQHTVRHLQARPALL